MTDIPEQEKEQLKNKVEEAEKYKRQVKRKIKKGILPTYHFAKDKGDKLERVKHPKYPWKTKLTWRLKSTLKELTKD